jgi:hypothetical protein
VNAELKLIEELLALDRVARARVINYVQAVQGEMPWADAQYAAERKVDVVPAPKTPPSAYVAREKPKAKRLISVLEASRHYKRAVPTIYRAIKERKLPVHSVKRGKSNVAQVRVSDMQLWTDGWKWSGKGWSKPDGYEDAARTAPDLE